MRRLASSLAVFGLLLAPASVQAQLFLASRPEPPFTVGPLMVRATVREAPGTVPVVVTWSLRVPPERRAADVAQDIYLLWPGEVRNDVPDGKPDAALARYVTEQGFDVVGEGRAGLRRAGSPTARPRSGPAGRRSSPSCRPARWG
ncbi:MAG TPA: hypothetical protein VK878_12540 [Candidatus Deferrimicrobiaceae bacterium]|nr:hypothetical protein [Candidatus Deferrimicrobiaceae bacterium]